MKTGLLIALSASICSTEWTKAADLDLSSALMNATFRISGPTQKTSGTCFIMGKPVDGDDRQARLVLVTADHVLSEIQGPTALLSLRKRTGDGYVKAPHAITIREDGKPLWTKHPNADLAVIPVRVPKDTALDVVSTELLATDERLAELKIKPGDRLFTLGYPLGVESNPAGFPVLRAGWISSYPILPTRETKHILLDFEVFPGNSGGPVFLVDNLRHVGGGTLRGGEIRTIVGLLSAEITRNDTFRTPLVQGVEKRPLKIGVVVHAAFIREIVEKLFDSPTPETSVPHLDPTEPQ